MLNKLEEAESRTASDDERLETRASSKASEKRSGISSEREDDDIDEDWAPSHAGNVIYRDSSFIRVGGARPNHKYCFFL